MCQTWSVDVAAGCKSFEEHENHGLTNFDVRLWLQVCTSTALGQVFDRRLYTQETR